MAKTETVHTRVTEEIKRQADEIFAKAADFSALLIFRHHLLYNTSHSCLPPA